MTADRTDRTARDARMLAVLDSVASARGMIAGVIEPMGDAHPVAAILIPDITEARVYVTDLLAERAALAAEVEGMKEARRRSFDIALHHQTRAERAEAECARLREALASLIEPFKRTPDDVATAALLNARAALNPEGASQ